MPASILLYINRDERNIALYTRTIFAQAMQDSFQAMKQEWIVPFNSRYFDHKISIFDNLYVQKLLKHLKMRIMTKNWRTKKRNYITFLKLDFVLWNFYAIKVFSEKIFKNWWKMLCKLIYSSEFISENGFFFSKPEKYWLQKRYKLEWHKFLSLHWIDWKFL